MYKIVKTAIFLAFVGGMVYVYRVPIQKFTDNLTTSPPCTKPITYIIEEYDARFGISEDDFIGAINEAEKIWEKPLGKELFSHVPKGGKLKINLKYDYRQEATDKMNEIGITIGDDRGSYDKLKKKYIALKSQYMDMKLSYVSLTASYKKREDTYNKEVSSWNTRGGAPRDIYIKLNQDRELLDAELEKIHQSEISINNIVKNINDVALILNHLGSTLNLNVAKFNEIGNSTGRVFDEGLYQSGSNGESIDIYQFDNHQKLVRVLAHELGHALGLEHVDDPRAIMYYLNESGNEKLTEADLFALKNRCGVKN